MKQPMNRLCRLLGIDLPIIQGGMVWVSDWHLASACSNAGMLGTIGTGSMTHELVKHNIEKMFEATDRPFAVNIPMLRPDAIKIGKQVIDMGVKILITSAGNPAAIVPSFKTDNTLLLHVAPSVKGAVKSESSGVDAVICEGYEAGGHNSPLEITTLALVPQVADAVNIPVVAAGGIADGRGIAAAMALGADGVQMGTRFLSTIECNAHIRHKKLIVEADDSGTCIIGRNLELMRVLKNDFAQRMIDAEKKGADNDHLYSIMGADFNRSRAASIDGNIIEGTFQAGQSSGLVKQIVSIPDLVQMLKNEYKTTVERIKPAL